MLFKGTPNHISSVPIVGPRKRPEFREIAGFGLASARSAQSGRSRICGLGLSLLAASLASVSAQVTVEVMLEQQQFLQGEALPAAVRITNRSGQPLRLGAEEDWLIFFMEGREGIKVVSKRGDPQVQGELRLESSKAAIERVEDLAPYFAITQPGRYAITATVSSKLGAVKSPPAQRGSMLSRLKIWEQEVGIPPSAGSAGAAPEIRKYILQQANYLKGRIRLYLRVMDANGKVFRVFPIGPMVSFGRPEPAGGQGQQPARPLPIRAVCVQLHGESSFQPPRRFARAPDLRLRRLASPAWAWTKPATLPFWAGSDVAATDLPKPPGPPADDSPPSTPQEIPRRPMLPRLPSLRPKSEGRSPKAERRPKSEGQTRSALRSAVLAAIAALD